MSNMSQSDKEWIDNASIYDLLARNRFAKPGSEWFQGERGEYHLKVMAEKRDADPGAYVAASKSMGW